MVVTPLMKLYTVVIDDLNMCMKVDDQNIKGVE